MAVNDHVWARTINGGTRCVECGIFTEQADANCWRPVETNRDKLAKALEAVLADFTVDHEGTVYYKGVTDGSNVHDRRY